MDGKGQQVDVDIVACQHVSLPGGGIHLHGSDAIGRVQHPLHHFDNLIIPAAEGQGGGLLVGDGVGEDRPFASLDVLEEWGGAAGAGQHRRHIGQFMPEAYGFVDASEASVGFEDGQIGAEVVYLGHKKVVGSM